MNSNSIIQLLKILVMIVVITSIFWLFTQKNEDTQPATSIKKDERTNTQTSQPPELQPQQSDDPAPVSRDEPAYDDTEFQDDLGGIDQPLTPEMREELMQFAPEAGDDGIPGDPPEAGDDGIPGDPPEAGDDGIPGDPPEAGDDGIPGDPPEAGDVDVDVYDQGPAADDVHGIIENTIEGSQSWQT